MEIVLTHKSEYQGANLKARYRGKGAERNAYVKIQGKFGNRAKKIVSVRSSQGVWAELSELKTGSGRTEHAPASSMR